MGKRTFRIILVEPSHYDDDGYVIQWWLSTIPSNSLASVYGLLAACAEEKTLGPDVSIELEAYDECNKIIDVKAMAKRIKADGGGFVGLVGVESNQFPRALDLARAFRKLDIPVVIGGFHVSGCISMLPELPADLKEAQALGVTLFAGEGEGRMAGLLRDIDAGQAKPLYNYLHDMPGMEAAAIPVLPKEVVGRIVGHHACFDAGRGCPFQCSFCTIINVQGRKSRYRTADDVEAIVRANYAQGINHYFVTDDNFARNRNWESILDRLIDLRETKGIPIKLILQVDTLCHRIPGFIEKAARAGCNQVFVGLESVNPRIAPGGEEAAEQDLGIPSDAASLAKAEGDDLGGHDHRFSDRHTQIDRPRHRDHQEGAAARHPRILFPDPPARLGGPPDPLPQRGPDGPRHEQVRSRACHHWASQHVARAVDEGLS